MNRFLIAVLTVVVLAGCTSDIAGINVPEPGQIAGAWVGNARWNAIQGGGSLGPVASGATTAIIFQSGAAIISGSTWEVTGIFTGTLSGSVDTEGRATGTATVLVLAPGCAASSSWGGRVEGDNLSITMSFADPGATPCNGAPVGLTLNLSR